MLAEAAFYTPPESLKVETFERLTQTALRLLGPDDSSDPSWEFERACRVDPWLCLLGLEGWTLAIRELEMARCLALELTAEWRQTHGAKSDAPPDWIAARLPSFRPGLVG